MQLNLCACIKLFPKSGFPVEVYVFLLPSNSFFLLQTAPHPRIHYTFLWQNYFSKNDGLVTILLPHSQTVNISHCTKGEIESRYPAMAFVAFQIWTQPPFHIGFPHSPYFTLIHSEFHIEGLPTLLVEFLLHWSRSQQEASGILNLDYLLTFYQGESRI